jgi:hypothetical protein
VKLSSQQHLLQPAASDLVHRTQEQLQHLQHVQLTRDSALCLFSAKQPWLFRLLLLLLLSPFQACNNTTPCPINCTGEWQVLNSSACTGSVTKFEFRFGIDSTCAGIYVYTH